MPRKLKTYQTSMGFFELAIAAPSMKAALEAWGAESNLFHQGVARQAEESAIVNATMAKPGVVLKRPVGSTGEFKEDAELPSDLVAGGGQQSTAKKRSSRKHRSSLDNERSARKAAASYEKQAAQRERTRQREEAARKRRDEAIKRAKTTIEKAEREHERKMREIDDERANLEKRAKVELTRWEKLKEKLDTSLRRARR